MPETGFTLCRRFERAPEGKKFGGGGFAKTVSHYGLGGWRSRRRFASIKYFGLTIAIVGERSRRRVEPTPLCCRPHGFEDRLAPGPCRSGACLACRVAPLSRPRGRSTRPSPTRRVSRRRRSSREQLRLSGATRQRSRKRAARRCRSSRTHSAGPRAPSRSPAFRRRGPLRRDDAALALYLARSSRSSYSHRFPARLREGRPRASVSGRGPVAQRGDAAREEGPSPLRRLDPEHRRPAAAHGVRVRAPRARAAGSSGSEAALCSSRVRAL